MTDVPLPADLPADGEATPAEDAELSLNEGSSAPDDSQEDASDLELPDRWYFGATLWSTDWTCETLIKQLSRGNIALSPRFQRRQAWRADRQSAFIESLILGLPIPQLILAEDKNRRGSFIVIDGKQRLLSMRQFAAPRAGADGFSQLRLRGLTDRPDLNGMSLESMQASILHQDDVIAFENQTVRTVIIRGWESDLYLHAVFLRINTGSVKLSPQELRQALHPGPFTDFIDDFSVECRPLQDALRLRRPDFRMRDTELVLRYFAYRDFASTYRGALKRFLDETVEELNRNWNEDSIRLKADDLTLALQTVNQIFGRGGELRKWNGRSYENQINRAVFDVMVYYFTDEEVRRRAVESADDVEAAFKALCEGDFDFLVSLESTTKSIEANRTRFGRWADALGAVIGMDLRSPFA